MRCGLGGQDSDGPHRLVGRARIRSHRPRKGVTLTPNGSLASYVLTGNNGAWRVERVSSTSGNHSVPPANVANNRPVAPPGSVIERSEPIRLIPVAHPHISAATSGGRCNVSASLSDGVIREMVLGSPALKTCLQVLMALEELFLSLSPHH